MHPNLLPRDKTTGLSMTDATRPQMLPNEADTCLGRIGALEVHLATSPFEVEAAQRLRYRVFYAERGAGAVCDLSRDADRFDDICDHLLVVDTSLAVPNAERIVGTYRLLPQAKAAATGGFYSSAEFGIEALTARHPGLNILELGRSCVLPAYRSRRTVELLWQGIWAYTRRHGIDVMAGCASFEGTVPARHAEALSFLHHNCRAGGDWAVRAVDERFASMDLMPAEAIRTREALAAMPPLIKGYLRLGAMIGEGCVIDHEFGTTDVFVVLPVAKISARYINYYGADAQRFAA
ncbi:MAG: GNAT family N-acetyltransferase [Rhizobiaceae bacterium]|nr:GNAT family N-acetyltransferase [Rhizobiaceae bacterium]